MATESRAQRNLVPRRLVFHTTALLGTGLYLLIMGTGGYYVRIYGGDWGIAAQAAFLFASGLLLAILLFSRQLRAWLKVIISKHFFDYKYDYREEWLRFIAQPVRRATGLAVARARHPGDCPDRRKPRRDIVVAPGWRAIRTGRSLEYARPGPKVGPADGALLRILEQHEWVINLDEQEINPKLRSSLQGLKLPEWLRNMTGAWLSYR